MCLVELNITMKFLLAGSLLVALASGIAVPKSDFVSYDGYKVFRVKTQGQSESIRDKLSSLSYEEWSGQKRTYFDIAIPPEELAAFERLDLDSHCMHQDLGASIKEESAKQTVWKRQVDDMSWFDSYHPYEDHQQYFDDLHAAFPDNSEMVSSGTSYEGRDMFGIHMWGADGPGKPAVLWHGTVHAREWITSMVSTYRSTSNVHFTGETDSGSSRSSNTSLFNLQQAIQPTISPGPFLTTMTSTSSPSLTQMVNLPSPLHLSSSPSI